MTDEVRVQVRGQVRVRAVRVRIRVRVRVVKTSCSVATPVLWFIFFIIEVSVWAMIFLGSASWLYT